MKTIERIKNADSKRLFDTFLMVGGDNIPVRVKLLSIDEFDQALELISSRNRKKVLSMLSGQFIDPETGMALFCVDDLCQMTRNTFDKVVELFIKANRGEEEKKS